MPVEGNIEGRKLDLKVSVDRSAEIEELQRQLEDAKQERDNVISEKEQLEADLTLIAEKEFTAKCKSLGLNPATTTVETLKEKEAEKRFSTPKPPAGEYGSTATLNPEPSQAIQQHGEEGYNTIEVWVQIY